MVERERRGVDAGRNESLYIGVFLGFVLNPILFFSIIFLFHVIFSTVHEGFLYGAL